MSDVRVADKCRYRGVCRHLNHWHGGHHRAASTELRSLHLLFAKHQNCLRGRQENFWASQQTSVVELIDTEDIVEKCAYVFANPVKDQLVERAHQWPGASGLIAMRHPRLLNASRPRRFFRAQGSVLPAATALEICVPPGFSDRAEFRRLVDQRIVTFEADAAAHRRERRARVLGRNRVLRQPWHHRPHSTPAQRRLSPTVACRNRWARVEALHRRKWWLDAYRDSRVRHVAGDRAVIFPAGTYGLARQSAVTVAQLPLRRVL